MKLRSLGALMAVVCLSAGASQVAHGGETAPASPPSAASKSAPAAKPGTASNMETYADWVRDCRPQPPSHVCVVRQTIRDAKKRRIVEFVAARSAKANYLELRLPLGISIPYGVFIVLDGGTKISTQLVDCGADGCRSVMRLDEETTRMIKASKSLSVAFQDSKSGKVITVSGSPKGFAEAIAKGLGPA
jgi:invasion protein IalB